jgi:4-diphosphocytidyl-2-C-methyl-D-erythritol kinase
MSTERPTSPVTRVLAPAKLTVSLRVTGVRPDGYHELDAEMVTLDLADELELTAGGSGLEVVAAPGTRAGDLPASDDLIGRALSACGRRAGVRLTKRIPLGGGLGGGSADAAAVLRWAGCTDLSLAARLGADVPFCLVGGRARVQGLGERVIPLDFEARDYLLVLPPFGVDTGRVYAAWDDGQRVDGDGEGANALTAAALAVEPRMGRWRDALGDLAGRAPALAGSGSTWFVEGGPERAGTPSWPELRVGGEVARLVRARTVPAGWDGG